MTILIFTPMSEALREILAKHGAHLAPPDFIRVTVALLPTLSSAMARALAPAPASARRLAALTAVPACSRLTALPRKQRTSRYASRARATVKTRTAGRKVRKLEPPHSSHSLPSPPPK